MSGLSIGVLILMACVIVTTFILYKTGTEKNVPYFNTFELHYTVAIMGLLTIVLLGDLNLIDKGNVSTLFSSLIAYVLGATSNKLFGNNSGAAAPLDGNQTKGTSPPTSGAEAGFGLTGNSTGSGSAATNSNSFQIPV